MWTASDFRRQAWSCLKGKWGTAAICTLIYAIILGACSALSFILIGPIVAFLLYGPLTMGMAAIALRIIRGFPFEVGTLFEGFKDFGRAFVCYLLIYIFTFLWSLLFIIPGIIKAFSYSMSFYIMLDRPELSANEARKLSMQMMKGNKWRLFCLIFSFIGWLLLCVLTLGILSFWVVPYMESAVAAFYQDLVQKMMDQNPPPATTANPVY